MIAPVCHCSITPCLCKIFVLCCAVVLNLDAAVHAGTWNNETVSMPRLYEVFFDKQCSTSRVAHLCTQLQAVVSKDDVVIVHRDSGQNEKGYFASSSLPCVMVNRHQQPKPAENDSWKDCLEKLLQQKRSDQWELSLYLAARSSSDDVTEVDIAVCNLERKRVFNGEFVIWLVEQTSMQGCSGTYWTVRQVLASGVITELPHDETRGCPMPDHFVLPTKQGTGNFALVGAVFDSNGIIQAVAKETLSSEQ